MQLVTSEGGEAAEGFPAAGRCTAPLPPHRVQTKLELAAMGPDSAPPCPMGGNGLPPSPAASSSAGSREQLPRRGSHTWNLWVRAPCASASGCHVLAAIVPLTCSKGFSAGRGIVALFLSTCECDSRTTTSSPRERCQESSCSKAYVYMAWKQPISFLAL